MTLCSCKNFIMLLLFFLMIAERTFIVLDKDFIEGDLAPGEPHVEGLFPELLHFRRKKRRLLYHMH